MHLLPLGPCVRTRFTFTLHLQLLTSTLPSQATLEGVQGRGLCAAFDWIELLLAFMVADPCGFLIVAANHP